jgi:anti-sigma B factor antagonist
VKVDVEQRAGRPVLVVRGVVDLASSPALRRRLLDQLETRPPELTVCLAEVSRMDSSGVAVLAEVVERARRTGTAIRFAALSEPVRTVIEMNRLADVLPIGPAT